MGGLGKTLGLGSLGVPKGACRSLRGARANWKYFVETSQELSFELLRSSPLFSRVCVCVWAREWERKRERER